MDVEKRTLVSEGIILTTVPVFGYALAFAYQSGYAYYFKIPPELISISMPQILLSTTSLVFIVLMLFVISDEIFTTLPDHLRQNPIVRRIARITPMVLLFIASLMLFGRRWEQWIIYPIIIGFQLALEFLRPLLAWHDKKTYAEKLAAEREYRAWVHNRSLFAHLERIVGASIIRFILSLVLVLWLAFSAGSSKALNRISYFVDTARTNTVILAIYDTRFVSATYDPSNHIVSTDLTIYEISDACPFSLKNEPIGPLSPMKSKEGEQPGPGYPPQGVGSPVP